MVCWGKEGRGVDWGKGKGGFGLVFPSTSIGKGVDDFFTFLMSGRRRLLVSGTT